MKVYEYFVNSINPDNRVAVIKNIGHEIDKSYKLNDGVRMDDIYSSSTILEIHQDSGDIITDFIDNIDRCVIISERVKKVFEQEGLDDEKVEYLPFVFHDKRRREIKTQYYIANSIVTVDCIDFEKSQFLEDEDDEPEDYEMQIIQVDKERIPEDTKFFRLGHQTMFIVFRSDLVDRINKEGFTGLSLTAMGERLR